MELTITGRNAGVTDRFRDYVTEKSEKITHLADHPLELQVKLSRHHATYGNVGPDRVEMTLIGKGPLVRAEAEGSDKYAAFDVAHSRLMERLRRAKDRKKVHRGRHRPESLREASADDFHSVALDPAEAEVLERVRTGSTPVVNAPESVDTEEYSPVVIRSKEFDAHPMSLDDALSNMELVGHDFYLFVDSETHRPSVVYRRKGWDYGVISLNVS